METLGDENGNFHSWTSFRRASLTKWIGYNETYAINDIIKLQEKMRYSLFENNESNPNPITLSRE